MTNQPIYWVQYALTWGTWTPCIANGNTREESRVEPTIVAEKQVNTKQAQERQPRWKWEKYASHENLSTKELAKLIRDEIKAKYPKKQGYNISVTSEYFSWGSAIDVSIKATPFKWFTDEYRLALDTNDRSAFNQWEWDQRRGTQTRYTPEMIEFIKQLEHIQNQYNFNDSDSQTDYFHVNYYGNVAVCYTYHKLLAAKELS